MPLQAPTNFMVQKVTGSTSALLSWNPVTEESIRGFFKGYKIQTWIDKDGEEGMQEIHLKNDTTETLVSKFVPYSKNYVRVLAYNGRCDNGSILFNCLIDIEG